MLRNQFFRTGGKLAATITSTGGWLDLTTRALVAPPASLLAALDELTRTDDFQALPARSPRPPAAGTTAAS
jgi:acyl-CoA thioester hydrolase